MYNLHLSRFSFACFCLQELLRYWTSVLWLQQCSLMVHWCKVLQNTRFPLMYCYIRSKDFIWHILTIKFCIKLMEANLRMVLMFHIVHVYVWKGKGARMVFIILLVGFLNICLRFITHNRRCKDSVWKYKSRNCGKLFQH